jgi:enoyl-[acyl-carrier protein] reductase I
MPLAGGRIIMAATRQAPEGYSIGRPLEGQKALILGIANEHSIAYGCAKALRKLGAELAITYLNDKVKPHVEPLAKELEATLFERLDVQQPDQFEALFDRIRRAWGRLNIAVHAIAFAPKEDVPDGLLNCTPAGFATAMDISCHSFIRLAQYAAPLMAGDGTLVAMSYYGANKVIPNYDMMGPVKAALESSVRYLAHELGASGIRVHAVSPGPMMARSISGSKDFDLLLEKAKKHSPLRKLVDIDDVGMATALLVTPFGRRMTGTTCYVDAGLHVMA